MNALGQILSQLEVNQTIYYQLTIIVVVFFLSKFVLMEKLKFVLENREEKTLKMALEAEEKKNEAEGLIQDYSKDIQKAEDDAYQEFSSSKEKFLDEENKKIKKAEEEISNSVMKAKEEFEEDIRGKKVDIDNEIAPMAKLLVEKVLK